MKTILLLEDDKNLNKGITLKLTKEGYQVLPSFGTVMAMELFKKHKVDLIISDITVEDGDGMEFCRDIRKISNVFFVFLTAMDQEIDVVNGYDLGADDYITKPFSLMVLISKVNALMRRAESITATLISSGQVTVSYNEMKVYKNGEEVILGKKEIQLLLYFMEHPCQILSKEQILEAVWDMDGQFVSDNTVAVNVSRLRSRLEDHSIEELYIKNVRGMGYIWLKQSIKQ